MRFEDEFKPIAGVYIIRCLINGKYYIGETKNIKIRMMNHACGKGQIFHKAVLKHGRENFEIEIYYLPDFSNIDRLDLEEELIKKFDCLVPNGYNVCPRGQERKGRKHSEESKRKISESNMGILNKNFGKSMPEETRRKISESTRGQKNHGYGKLRPDQVKQKISKSKLGHVTSEETKQKISISAKKNKISEETRVKMMEGRRRFFLEKRKNLN